MRNYNFQQDVSLNLFQFYVKTGEALNCIKVSTDHFIALESGDASWPNLSFFHGAQSEFFQALKLLAGHHPKTFICPKASIDASYSKDLLTLGYVPYAKWQGMTLDLSTVVSTPLSDAYSIKEKGVANVLNQTLLANATISERSVERLAQMEVLNFHSWIVNNQPVSVMTSFETGTCAGFYFVATFPEFRRKGYASQLLLNAVSALKNNDISRVILHSTPAGLPLYRRLGFQNTEEFVLFRKK